jgi:hypothetical protein
MVDSARQSESRGDLVSWEMLACTSAIPKSSVSKVCGFLDFC